MILNRNEIFFTISSSLTGPILLINIFVFTTVGIPAKNCEIERLVVVVFE
jgi:hypothetical protein